MIDTDSRHVLSASPTPPLRLALRRITVLDGAERLIVLMFYLQMVVRLVRDAYLLHNPMAMLLLPSEGLVIALVVLRRPARELTTRWSDWFAALAATALPTLVVATAGPRDGRLMVLAGWLAITGLTVQVHAKLTLGRTMGMVAANRGIRVAGPYQWIRHPMYLGYFISHVAFLSMNWCAWNLGVLSLVTLLQVYRVVVEEKLLANDPEYRSYRDRVRYRLVPGVF